MKPYTCAGRMLVCASALVLCIASDAFAQQKQKVSFTANAKDSKYTQRLLIEVGDEVGHQVGSFEIHRQYGADAPAINGVKIKESWARGYADYIQNTGVSVNYTTYVMDNGDKFYVMSKTMGQADGSGKRKTTGIGEIRGGTGKMANLRGVVRSTGASDGKTNYNETQTEIEYWLTN
jgi:hypothetical protein